MRNARNAINKIAQGLTLMGYQSILLSELIRFVHYKAKINDKQNIQLSCRLKKMMSTVPIAQPRDDEKEMLKVMLLSEWINQMAIMNMLCQLVKSPSSEHNPAA